MSSLPSQIRYIIEENLFLQIKDRQKIRLINGELSPDRKRSFFNNTMKLFYDEKDYSKNLLFIENKEEKKCQ